MKSRSAKVCIFLVFCAFITLAGCASRPELYQFGLDESNSASISFKTGNPNVKFVSFEGKTLPVAEKGKRWEPILFPSGKPMLITVHAYYEHEQKVWVSGGLLGFISETADIIGTVTRGVNTNVVLTCPPLMPGTKYQLSFKKGPGIPGKNTLIITDLSKRKVFYEQEFDTKDNK